jgi:hypothetical protein
LDLDSLEAKENNGYLNFAEFIPIELNLLL